MSRSVEISRKKLIESYTLPALLYSDLFTAGGVTWVRK